MIIRFTGAFLALAMVGIAVQASADTTTDAKKAIQAQYDRGSSAASKKNLSAMVAIFTPDFTNTELDGTVVSLVRLKQAMATVISTMKSFKATFAIQSITLKGGRATVRVKGHTELVDVDAATKKTSTSVVDEIDEDVWVKSGSTWLDKASVVKSEKMTKDGQAVPVPGAH